MEQKFNMVKRAAECFLPEYLHGMEQGAEDKQQEQAVQEPQPSNVPNFAAIAANCFLPKG